MERGEQIMVTFHLFEITAEKAIYKYYPESETGKYGIVSVDRRTFKRKIEKLCEGYGDEYAFHALSYIERYARNNSFKESGKSVWY